uniref:Uncharacterized protein n=1 Tax=Acrobeloides nanus TaxID=290746 RepID=A0A914EQ96_9BILA
MLAEILKNYENLDPSIIESSQEAQHVPDEKYENIRPRSAKIYMDKRRKPVNSDREERKPLSKMLGGYIPEESSLNESKKLEISPRFEGRKYNVEQKENRQMDFEIEKKIADKEKPNFVTPDKNMLESMKNINEFLKEINSKEDKST